VEAVRRINVIKKMMAEGHTLEDIKRSYVFHRNHIDQLERDLAGLLNGFQEELGDRAFGGEHRRTLEAELATLRQRAQDLVRDVARLGSAVTARADETIRSQ
jgi:ParB-like chromosome segregation protein Spo0J